MSAARDRVLCIGGTLNGDLAPRSYVVGGRMYAPGVAPSPREWMTADLDLIAPEPMRTIVYNLDRIGWTNPNGTREVHDCLVAEGYPKHRITEALNAIAALAALTWTVKPRPPASGEVTT